MTRLFGCLQLFLSLLLLYILDRQSPPLLAFPHGTRHHTFAFGYRLDQYRHTSRLCSSEYIKKEHLIQPWASYAPYTSSYISLPFTLSPRSGPFHRPRPVTGTSHSGMKRSAPARRPVTPLSAKCRANREVAGLRSSRDSPANTRALVEVAPARRTRTIVATASLWIQASQQQGWRGHFFPGWSCKALQRDVASHCAYLGSGRRKFPLPSFYGTFTMVEFAQIRHGQSVAQTPPVGAAGSVGQLLLAGLRGASGSFSDQAPRSVRVRLLWPSERYTSPCRLRCGRARSTPRPVS
jgi:hypothetical protein